MFIFRLIHFKYVINNIDIELTGRDKELVKPCLQLFSNPTTEEDKGIYFEIKNTFMNLLESKSSKKDFTIEAAFLPIITKLMQESRTRTITFSEFWDELKRHINGKQDEKRPNEFHTEDFGTIYRNSISDKLQKLGVDTKRHNRYTELIFNRHKIMKNLHQYNLTIQTELVGVSEEGKDLEKWEKSEHSERCEDYIDNTTNSVEIQHDGIHKVHNEKDMISDTCTVANDDQDTNNVQQSKEEDGPNTSESSQEHSQRSQQSPEQRNSATSMKGYKELIKMNLYRIGNTDVWGCRNCKQKDDIWYMEQHPCKGIINKSNDTKLQNKSNYSLYMYMIYE